MRVVPGILVTAWLAVVSGGLVAIALLIMGKRGRKSAIPFGPFLALGALAALTVGPELIDWYRGWLPTLGGSGT